MKNLVELDSWEQDVVFELVTTQVEMLWDSNTEEELHEPDTWKQFMEMNHMVDLLVTVGGLTEPTTKQYLNARHYYFTQKQQDQELNKEQRWTKVVDEMCSLLGESKLMELMDILGHTKDPGSYPDKYTEEFPQGLYDALNQYISDHF